MKIGIFDSGLGGLITLRAITKALPKYDYVYLGDTQRVPYGDRSQEAIYQFLREGIDFLFARDCALVIVACNTASAEALRLLQQEYLPSVYPDRRVLGMIVPMTEASAAYATVGILATEATVSSGAYPREFKKRAKGTRVRILAAPLLVPLIERGEMELAEVVLKKYLTEFKAGEPIDALVLGCTHYALIKDVCRKHLPKRVAIISQDDVVPEKTRQYLAAHPEMETRLSKNKARELYVTDLTKELQKRAGVWFGKKMPIDKVSIEK